MDEWTIYGAEFTDELARNDPIFSQMREEQTALVPAFDHLMESLPQNQRDLILDYLNLQTDMESRKTALIWAYKKNGAA